MIPRAGTGRPPGVAVALEGYGWHPEAWRHTPDRREPSSARHWVELSTIAERGLLDFVTFDDGLTPQRRRRPEIEPRWLAGRPDAVMVAAHVAAATRHVGLIPVAGVTHTAPSALSSAIATLDVLSHGRAGWQPRVSSSAHEAALFGGRRDAGAGDVFAAAVDAVAEVRRLWDGDGASASSPPQGHPVVAVLAHNRAVYEFASATADLVFVTPLDDQQVTAMGREVVAVGGADLAVYADVFVASGGVVDPRTEALVFDGGAAELVDLVLRWQLLGIDGVRLRPAVNAVDLPFIVEEFMPELRAATGSRTQYVADETLRDRLGLPAAVNRYAKVRQP